MSKWISRSEFQVLVGLDCDRTAKRWLADGKCKDGTHKGLSLITRRVKSVKGIPAYEVLWNIELNQPATGDYNDRLQSQKSYTTPNSDNVELAHGKSRMCDAQDGSNDGRHQKWRDEKIFEVSAREKRADSQLPHTDLTYLTASLAEEASTAESLVSGQFSDLPLTDRCASVITSLTAEPNNSVSSHFFGESNVVSITTAPARLLQSDEALPSDTGISEAQVKYLVTPATDTAQSPQIDETTGEVINPDDKGYPPTFSCQIEYLRDLVNRLEYSRSYKNKTFTKYYESLNFRPVLKDWQAVRYQREPAKYDFVYDYQKAGVLSALNNQFPFKFSQHCKNPKEQSTV